MTGAPDERFLDGRQRATARWWLGRLAAVRREMEELGLETLGDDLLPAAAVAPLEALEESFFFALSTDAERRSQVLTAEEVGDEVLALHAEGTWGW